MKKSPFRRKDKGKHSQSPKRNRHQTSMDSSGPANLTHNTDHSYVEMGSGVSPKNNNANTMEPPKIANAMHKTVADEEGVSFPKLPGLVIKGSGDDLLPVIQSSRNQYR